MFERFTDRARRVVVLAQEEARFFNHDYIGTEHLLLGLIHEGEGIAAIALDSFGISLEAVRGKVEDLIGQGDKASPEHIPFSPRTKKVLELSLREALQLGHNYIGTEHILLGLIREGEGVAAQIITRLGVDLPRIREQATSIVGIGAGTQATTSPMFLPRPGVQLINPGVLAMPGQAPELRQVIALGQPIRLEGDAALTPISLTIWSSFVELRYAASSAHGQPSLIDPNTWAVEDDLGTSYRYAGAAASGYGTLLLATVCFEPPPPRDATRLSLLGPSGARLDIGLRSAPAEVDPGPSAEPVPPDHVAQDPEAGDRGDRGASGDE